MAESDFNAKACSRCFQVKPAGSFGSCKNSKTGLRSQCRQCQAAADKAKNDKLADAGLREKKAARDALIKSGACLCIACKAILPLSEFPNISRRAYKCRACATALRLKWSQENRERDKATWATQAAKWKDRKQAKNKDYRAANQQDLYAARRRWYQENKESFNKKNYEAQKQRLKTDPVFALKRRVARLVSLKIQNAGFTKKSRTFEILGCDWDFFKRHIERQFLNGMTWENRSKWHLDHIFPISLAVTESEVLRLNHFTNLRPMWAKDNLAKGAQIQALL